MVFSVVWTKCNLTHVWSTFFIPCINYTWGILWFILSLLPCLTLCVVFQSLARQWWYIPATKLWFPQINGRAPSDHIVCASIWSHWHQWWYTLFIIHYNYLKRNNNIFIYITMKHKPTLCCHIWLIILILKICNINFLEWSFWWIDFSLHYHDYSLIFRLMNWVWEMIKWMTIMFKIHYASLQWNRNSVDRPRPMGLLFYTD